MSALREAAQQALEALRVAYGCLDDESEEESEMVLKAITALRAALAEPEQEPVAWITKWEHQGSRGTVIGYEKERQHGNVEYIPLYTNPPTHKVEPEQEPIAYFDPQEKGFYWAKPMRFEGVPITVSVEPIALYTHPPQRKPLTDEEIIGLWQRTKEPDGHRIERFARAVLAAHGIKQEEA